MTTETWKALLRARFVKAAAAPAVEEKGDGIEQMAAKAHHAAPAHHAAKAPKRKSRRIDLLQKKRRALARAERERQTDEPMLKRGGAATTVASSGNTHLVCLRPGPVYSLRPHLRLCVHRAICNVFERPLVSVEEMDRIAVESEMFWKPGAGGVLRPVRHHDPTCGDYSADVALNALRAHGFSARVLSGHGKTWWQHVTTNAGPFLVFVTFKGGDNGTHCIGISQRGICNDGDTDDAHLPLTEHNFIKLVTTPPRRKAQIVRLYELYPKMPGFAS